MLPFKITVYVSVCECVERPEDSVWESRPSFRYMGSRGLNSGLQTWLLAPFPAEPALWRSRQKLTFSSVQEHERQKTLKFLIYGVRFKPSLKKFLDD